MRSEQCPKCDCDLVNGKCLDCERKQAFADFARKCGLDSYPDPTGERYMYDLDGRCCGKKIECVDSIDDLWNALARVMGRDDLAV